MRHVRESWTRRVWGVELDGRLLGRRWDERRGPAYPVEPARLLLFSTRAVAREWCAGQHVIYGGRSDVCGTWRFRAVRVREIVRRIR